MIENAASKLLNRDTNRRTRTDEREQTNANRRTRTGEREQELRLRLVSEAEGS